MTKLLSNFHRVVLGLSVPRGSGSRVVSGVCVEAECPCLREQTRMLGRLRGVGLSFYPSCRSSTEMRSRLRGCISGGGVGRVRGVSTREEFECFSVLSSLSMGSRLLFASFILRSVQYVVGERRRLCDCVSRVEAYRVGSTTRRGTLGVADRRRRCTAMSFGCSVGLRRRLSGGRRCGSLLLREGRVLHSGKFVGGLRPEFRTVYRELRRVSGRARGGL